MQNTDFHARLLFFAQQDLPGEFELSVFRIQTDQLDLDLVTLFQAGLFHVLEPSVINLRDMEQTVFAGKNFDEGAERYDRLEEWLQFL